MKVEITDQVVSRQVITKNGPATFRHQPGYIQLPGKKFPVEIQVPIPNAATPYAAGVYTIDVASMVYVGNYGDLRLSRELKFVK